MLKGGSRSRAAFLCAGLTEVDPRRRYPEFHPRLQRKEGIVNAFYKKADVVSPPIGAADGGGRKIAGISSVRSVVVEGSGRIEIIIEMNAVNVVALRNIGNHAEDIIPHGGQAWIERNGGPVAEQPFGVLFGYVRWYKIGELRSRSHRSVRIEPSVQLHPSFVAFLNGKLQRIPTGVSALRTGKGRRPRLYGTAVQGIALVAHLKKDRIHARCFVLIENGD